MREAALMSRGKRIPGDAITDILRDIQEGALIKEATDPYSPDPIEAAHQRLEEDQALQEAQEEVHQYFAQQHASAQPSRPAIDIPVEILDVLKSPERQELIEVAQLLRRSQEHARTMLFVTPVGDIRCTINWMSCRPNEINTSSMFFVKTRANSLAFIPKPGAVFDISFEGMRGSAKVVCLAEPQRIYPGVDLLCFMPHTPFVEKTGQLKEGAPSVVSGLPSTEVVDGEPVAEGEKPMSKSAFNMQPPANRDFDQVRP